MGFSSIDSMGNRCHMLDLPPTQGCQWQIKDSRTKNVMTLVVSVTERGANRKYDVKKTILLEITLLFFLVSMFPFWRCVALLDRIFAQKSRNTEEGPAFRQKPRVEK